MISTEYEIVWLAYLVAALGCFWVWTFFTRWMWRYLREPLWVVMAVILFSPTLVEPNGSDYAPALAMATMDILFKVNNDAWRALSDITLYMLLAFAGYALLVCIRWLVFRVLFKRTFKTNEQNKRKKAAAAQKTKPHAEPTLQEILAMEKSSAEESGFRAQR